MSIEKKSKFGLLPDLSNPLATIIAALIVTVAGSFISMEYASERDKQDKESQWRQHAIELTKLDLERKLKDPCRKASEAMRPSILDFLANYRTLQELGDYSPKELYEKTINQRVIRNSGRCNKSSTQ